MFEDNMNKWAAQRGYKFCIGEIDAVYRVAEDLEQKKDSHEIDHLFFKENLSFFEKSDYHGNNQGQTVIIVALPRSAHYVGFTLGKDIVKMVLPPTYVNYRSAFIDIRRDLEKNVFFEEIKLKTLNAPLKALACYLGMAIYGKNNISYIPEFGSYFQLVGYLANSPFLDTGSLNGSQTSFMKECENCIACSKACPMNAISKDRFLLHAEKCYTLHSESSRNLPDGLHPPSPDCLFGCLRCQEICPANRGKLQYEESGVLFSEEETQAVLQGDPIPRELSEPIEAKYKSLGLTENSDIFFRNLRFLMKQKKV